MANKGPKTEKGKKRKLWTGDGRKRTPEEQGAKMFKDTDKAMKRTDREVRKFLSGPSSGNKKK
jgi:hypothetical protein